MYPTSGGRPEFIPHKWGIPNSENLEKIKKGNIQMINSTNTLAPVEHEGQRVITTELLAEVYETSTDRIKQNFNRNKENFKEGVHYFLLQGDTLRLLRTRYLLATSLVRTLLPSTFGQSAAPIGTAKSLIRIRRGNSLTIWRRPILR